MSKKSKDQPLRWSPVHEFRKIMRSLNQLSETPDGKAAADQLINLIQHPDRIESFMQSMSTQKSLWDNPHIYHLLGYIYFYQNQPHKALEMFQQALMLDPEDTYALEFKELCQEDIDNPTDKSEPELTSGLRLGDLEFCDDMEALIENLTELTFIPEDSSESPDDDPPVEPIPAAAAPAVSCAPSQTAEKITDLLDCPCTIYPPSADPGPLKEAYFSALKKGQKLGFTPIMIKSDPAFLDRMNGWAETPFPSGSTKRTIEDGSRYLEDLIVSARELWEDSGKDPGDLSGLTVGGDSVKSFSCYWNYATGLTDEMILAEIPCARPWELFAWLPDHICSGMPDTPAIIGIAKYWYLLYGAVPATISHNVLEFYTETPVYPESAYGLAWEHYAFCPALLKEEGNGQTIGWLADSLARSTVWRFQWIF